MDNLHLVIFNWRKTEQWTWNTNSYPKKFRTISTNKKSCVKESIFWIEWPFKLPNLYLHHWTKRYNISFGRMCFFWVFALLGLSSTTIKKQMRGSDDGSWIDHLVPTEKVMWICKHWPSSPNNQLLSFMSLKCTCSSVSSHQLDPRSFLVCLDTLLCATTPFIQKGH